ncbi:MAG: beta-lactamase family protein [Tannerellaceae bacterium]|nr:beta-lactamase family protein [Tannerellaceae bacterium]
MIQKIMCSLVSICLFIFVQISCVQSIPESYPDGLERSTPEAQGIPSTAILDFIETVEKKGIELHSLMILRHGKVIAEGWWNPFQPDTRHIMYSVSKTITSTAVGFAIAENHFALDDKIITFFPDYQISDSNREITIRNLLTMTAGEEPYTDFRLRSNDWIADYLAFNQPNKTGKFTYNSYATYMLSAIVQRTTGQTLMEYLQPRLFTPLGIHDIKSEQSPAGITCGGWGMSIKTADMAKIGQLYLQKGNWQGKQILSQSWIEEATKQTDTGYGYHIWLSPSDSYKAEGAFGQLILVMPGQDIVLAITANASGIEKEFRNHILSAISGKKLPENPKAYQALTKKLNSLEISPLCGNGFHQNDYTGIYTIENNNDIKEIGIDFTEELCTLYIRTFHATHTLRSGNGNWQHSQTDKNSPYYNAPYRNPIGLAPFVVAGSHKWTAPNQIKMKYMFIEDLSNETYYITFEKNKITVTITENSEDPQKTPTVLRGTRKTITR